MIELSHVRDDATLPLAQTGVELLVELGGTAHADALANDLDEAGYPTRTGGVSAARRRPRPSPERLPPSGDDYVNGLCAPGAMEPCERLKRP